jgi:hypothetical protein
MTEATIYALIGALADGQVYPYVVPLNAGGACRQSTLGCLLAAD